MRILTYSTTNPKGLIGISEASENSPQEVLFCIPIKYQEASNIKDLDSFARFFFVGISTKIIVDREVKTIDLSFNDIGFSGSRRVNYLPTFSSNLNGEDIYFRLSARNFIENDITKNLKFDFFYSGTEFSELANKVFVILEPNWKVLDQLFLTNKILFTDWA